MIARESAMIARTDITGLVLAGGQGRRMGGVDKGLVDARRPAAGRARASSASRRRSATLVINANQNRERYAAFGYPVVADAIGGFAGPLAGLHAGIAAATTPLVVDRARAIRRSCRPISSRVSRAAFDAQPIDLAVARTFDQPHPVFSLVRRDVRPHLEAFLRRGRKRRSGRARNGRGPMRRRASTSDAFRQHSTN